MTETGGFLYSLSSVASISQCIVNNATAPTGAAIVSSFGGGLHIHNSSFSQLYASESASIIVSYRSDVNIESSTFENFYASGIVGESVETINIRNSTFSNGDSGAIRLNSVTSFNVENSMFQNLTSY